MKQCGGESRSRGCQRRKKKSKSNGIYFPTAIVMFFPLCSTPASHPTLQLFSLCRQSAYNLTPPPRTARNDIHQKNGTEKNHHETFWSFGFLLWLCSIMINGRTWRQREKKHTISLWTLTHAWMIAKTLVSGEAKSPARDTAALKICLGQSKFFEPTFTSGTETVEIRKREKQIKARVVLYTWVVTTMAPLDLWKFLKKKCFHK